MKGPFARPQAASRGTTSCSNLAPHPTVGGVKVRSAFGDLARTFGDMPQWRVTRMAVSAMIARRPAQCHSPESGVFLIAWASAYTLIPIRIKNSSHSMSPEWTGGRRRPDTTSEMTTMRLSMSSRLMVVHFWRLLLSWRDCQPKKDQNSLIEPADVPILEAADSLSELHLGYRGDFVHHQTSG